ncbi:MAG: DUF2683 family protein [archaeon]
MPVAIVEINEKNNQIINIVKAQYGLRDKSQAINKLVEEYARLLMPMELRPEYLKKLEHIEKEKSIRVNDADGFFKKMRSR